MAIATGLELCPALAYFSSMLIVHVYVHVKPDSLEAFKTITAFNARFSLLELGCLRFDVLQQQDDPTRFVLEEVYRNAAAQAEHKETSHYAEWRDAVEPMMAEPRTSVKLGNFYPTDENWR